MEIGGLSGGQEIRDIGVPIPIGKERERWTVGVDRKLEILLYLFL